MKTVGMYCYNRNTYGLMFMQYSINLDANPEKYI